MDLLKKITEDWFNEFNTEIRRGKYPETRLNANFFDAIDGENDGFGTTTIHTESGSNTKDSGEGEQKKKSDINNIQ